MAINRANGFTPINLRPEHVHQYWKSTSANTIIGIGDPVIRRTDSADPNGFPEIVRATTGAAVTGVVVGIVPIRSNLNQRYLGASDTGYVLVADWPYQEFEVQDNGASGGLIITNIGQHVNHVTAIDANTTTGRSNYALDAAALATNNTWRIERLSEVVGNAVGGYAFWVVKPNLTTEANASATNLTEV